MSEQRAPTILDEIVAWNRGEVARRRARLPLPEMRRLAAQPAPPRAFAEALLSRKTAAQSPRLIAEIKRASPSKGPLRPDLDPAALAGAYEAGGAAAISVLTEPRYFQGSLEDLSAAKAATRLPVLRKDFLFDPYQVYEARAHGADAVLLIVAVLDDSLLGRLLSVARDLGLGALVECHNEAEVARALAAGAPIIGFNNRDLGTFRVDLETTHRLRPLVPPGYPVVSESGIHTSADVARLREWGVDAMLVGEALVKSDDVQAKVKGLLA